MVPPATKSRPTGNLFQILTRFQNGIVLITVEFLGERIKPISFRYLMRMTRELTTFKKMIQQIRFEYKKSFSWETYEVIDTYILTRNTKALTLSNSSRG